MLTLALSTRAETYDRLDRDLPEYGIEVRHLETTGRTTLISPDTTLAEEVDVGLVFPSRLVEGGVASVLADVPWVNDREAIVTSRNKAEVLARLARAGVPTPESVLVSNPVGQGELRAVFERFDPPVVIKPNSATRGTGIALAHDLDSFLGICDYLSLIHEFPATDDKSFLIQEYLPEARDYRAMIVDGEYVGAVEREGTGWKHNVHAGARATGVALPGDLRRLAERAANVLGIPFLGVDLLVSEGRAVVSETNARPTVDEATKYEPDFDDRLAKLIHARTRN
ncbi:ATP-grasp domain-containing protein [Halalkalicoccus subterraneus]|uniref:ATP-grasp domain-containing protein n=1 Tax=Halalkalicoccus subterraneus TaxID=2675002 RepID=UPI000EFD0D35|nr:RimK family alpha-L-glutamate ligase [Halalkalicoccus subterraneus]